MNRYIWAISGPQRQECACGIGAHNASNYAAALPLLQIKAGHVHSHYGSELSGIWGLGFMAMIGYNLDPLVLVLPFLIALMAARHSMQLISRYLEEVEKGADVKTAARTMFIAMFFPGIAAILTDAVGTALIAISVIPILTNIAIACTLWCFATFVLSLFFTPLILSYSKNQNGLRHILNL